MTNIDLFNLFIKNNNVPMDVIVTSRKGFFEDIFFNVGMKFSITNIIELDNSLKFVIDCGKYKEYNRQFYTHDFRSRHNGIETDVESAGYFPKNNIKETFLEETDDNFNLFTSIKSDLFEMDTGNNHDPFIVERINNMLSAIGRNDVALEFILKQYMDDDDLKNLIQYFNSHDSYKVYV